MKKFSLLALIFALFLSACNTSSETEKGEENMTATADPENAVLIDMDVAGMTCTGCENTIKSGVSELDGVVKVEASHTEAKTYVKADTSLTSIDEIAEMIRSKGYQVESSTIKEGEMPNKDKAGTTH